MIKLKAELGGEEHQISIQQSDSKIAAEIDDRKYRLELRDLGEGDYLLIDGHTIYNCHVVDAVNQPGNLEVTLRGTSYKLKLIDPKRLRSAQSGTAHHKGAAEIVAPMPGKVVRVLVQSGVEVEAGAGILVVEAMKMQNEMKAPKAGKVVSINAVVGATVNAGDVLAVVE